MHTHEAQKTLPGALSDVNCGDKAAEEVPQCRHGAARRPPALHKLRERAGKKAPNAGHARRAAALAPPTAAAVRAAARAAGPRLLWRTGCGGCSRRPTRRSRRACPPTGGGPGGGWGRAGGVIVRGREGLDSGGGTESRRRPLCTESETPKGPAAQRGWHRGPQESGAEGAARPLRRSEALEGPSERARRRPEGGAPHQKAPAGSCERRPGTPFLQASSGPNRPPPRA
jgi:hypothetical protein